MAAFYHQLDRETGAWIKKDQQFKMENDKFLKKLDTTKKARGPRTETKFIGVSYCARSLRWRAYISVDGVTHRLGLYDTDREAAIARDHVAIKHGRPTNILQKVS